MEMPTTVGENLGGNYENTDIGRACIGSYSGYDACYRAERDAVPGTASRRAQPQTNWWSQAGGENGPTRIVWAAHKNPETPYSGPNKPIWHIADILKAHQGQPSWDQQVLLTRDFDGHYVSMAPGEKTKCMFYADDRAFGWIYSGQVKITIDGQEPKVLPKGWVFNVAPRLSYCMENTGTEPVVFYLTTPAGQVAVLSGKRDADALQGLHL